MSPIFDPEELTIMTPEESSFYKQYIKQCMGYMNNEVDGVKMKQTTVQVANLAKIVQSRSATAMLKFNMLNRGDEAVIAKMTQKSIESK